MAPSSSDSKTPQRYGGSTLHDEEVWGRLERAFAQNRHPLRDVLESFPVYIRRVEMGRFLAHYELYKMIQTLPGCIVDCGVYRGVSLFTWAKILEILHPGDRVRRVIGFDSFQGFTSLHDKDGPQISRPNIRKEIGGWNPGDFYQELLEHVDIFHHDSYLPRKKRIELVAGDLVATAPQYVEANPGLRISLLHLDLDLYEPTMSCLKAFYPKVLRGGLVVLDEYAIMEWGGESAACEEYFAAAGQPVPRLQKFPFSSRPGGFFVKD